MRKNIEEVMERLRRIAALKEDYEARFGSVFYAGNTPLLKPAGCIGLAWILVRVYDGEMTVPGMDEETFVEFASSLDNTCTAEDVKRMINEIVGAEVFKVEAEVKR